MHAVPNEKGVFVSLDDPQVGQSGGLLSRLMEFLGLRSRPREMQEIVDESEERGLIDEDEGEMIEGIVELRQTIAREIMIPRTHMVTLSFEADKEEILQSLIETGHSRIPVYKDSVDQVIGILYAKDLLPQWLKEAPEVDLEGLCREPYFVPESKRIKDLLGELRTRKSHMAVIVDEYGGTAGIVTMEDIFEEIIGEIHDEHDVEEELFTPQKDGSVLVSARTPLTDFEERFSAEIPRGGYDSVGGFIIHLLGRVPRPGEKVQHRGLSFRISSADAKRISRVEVNRESDPEKEDSGNHAQPSP
ncbi:hemolysin family protein [Thermodesulfobacteriota bacterium]